MTMPGAGTSASPGETSSFHTVLEECLPLGYDVALGDRCCAGSSMEQKSEYFSARVEEMTRSKSEFSSDVEHDIEHSRVHWSEVPRLSELSEDNEDEEEVNRENREVFAELANDQQRLHHKYGHFSREWGPDQKLGRKIAEGGQAGIFEVIDDDGNVDIDHLLKVFKRGSRLSDLKKQWPCGILRMEVELCILFRGILMGGLRF